MTPAETDQSRRFTTWMTQKSGAQRFEYDRLSSSGSMAEFWDLGDDNLGSSAQWTADDNEIEAPKGGRASEVSKEG